MRNAKATLISRRTTTLIVAGATSFVLLSPLPSTPPYLDVLVGVRAKGVLRHVPPDVEVVVVRLETKGGRCTRGLRRRGSADARPSRDRLEKVDMATLVAKSGRSRRRQTEEARSRWNVVDARELCSEDWFSGRVWGRGVRRGQDSNSLSPSLSLSLSLPPSLSLSLALPPPSLPPSLPLSLSSFAKATADAYTRKTHMRSSAKGKPGRVRPCPTTTCSCSSQTQCR